MKAANILEEITARTKERMEKRQAEKSMAEVVREAEALCGSRVSSQGAASNLGAFYRALKIPGMSYICEVKKASPSKGLIAEDFPYLEIAAEYQAAGAAAISCLTEPFYFKGSDQYLKRIAEAVDIPVLRKDFTVNQYMIYEAKTLGASAVLLICSILEKQQLEEYIALAEKLGMDALVEAHDEDEVNNALDAGAKIIGVNNRDFKTFEIDMGNSIGLRKLAPDDVVFVSESGIRTDGDIRLLRDNNVDAVLIGETLMRSGNKQAALEYLNGGPLKGADRL